MVLIVSGHTSMLVSNFSPQAIQLSRPVQLWDTENTGFLDSKAENPIAVVLSPVIFQ